MKPSCHLTLTRDFLTGLVIPAALLIILIIVPPHAFDLSISFAFFDNGWPWHQNEVFSWVFYKLPKVVPFLIALPLVIYMIKLVTRGERLLQHDLGRRALYVVVAMALSAITVWWLKDTTGVPCPWDVVHFGGKANVTDPTFSLTHQHGSCWPSGHAGTGFVLFALYFALKDRWPRVAIATGLFAFIFGSVCGFARVMEGAHFVSHVVATGLIDWIICAALSALFFPQKLQTPSSSQLSVKGLILFTTLWWTLVLNAPFFVRIMGIHKPEFVWMPHDLVVLGALVGGLFAIALALITLLTALPRPVARTLLLLLGLCGSVVFTGECLYGITFNPDMARNILATDPHEASTYLSLRTVVLTSVTFLPILVATLGADLRPLRMTHVAWRMGTTLGALVLGFGVMFTQMNSLSSLFRADRSARYLIAPVNVPYSMIATLTKDTSPDLTKRRIVDPTPTLLTDVKRPAVLLVVIGETTRSANWELAGYNRPTNPALRQLSLINHPEVVACGTSTDVSLPCMMSRIGRSDYDRQRIISEEALPGLLQRAGVNVLWVDNQSGCKGACQGVPTRTPTPNNKDCPNGRCFDGVLVEELQKDLAALPTDRPTVLFYHLYGEHGPRYHQDSPDGMKPWQPECMDADLGACPRDTVVNAYDNAVRYTDSVLADLIKTLDAQSNNIDSGFIFVSDHGESLGENGLFLHGAPYFMAPDEQTRVPMVMWFSKDWAKAFGTHVAELTRQPKSGVTHEHLYSTVLGLLNVKSSTYRAQWDLSARNKSAQFGD